MEIPSQSPLPNSNDSFWLHFPSGLSVLLLLSFHLDVSLALSPFLIKEPDKLDFSNLKDKHEARPLLWQLSAAPSCHKMEQIPAVSTKISFWVSGILSSY